MNSSDRKNFPTRGQALAWCRRARGLQGRGAAAVEFALILPIFCLILLGIMEFSLALYNKAVITNAAREGARAGITLRSPKLTTAQIQQIVLSYTNGALVDPGGNRTPVVTVIQSSPASFPNPLRVTVSFTFQGIAVGALFSAIRTPLVLTSSAVMVNE